MKNALLKKYFGLGLLQLCFTFGGMLGAGTASGAIGICSPVSTTGNKSFGTIQISPTGSNLSDLPARQLFSTVIKCKDGAQLNVNDTAFIKNPSGSYGPAGVVVARQIWKTNINGVGLKINVFRVNGIDQSLGSSSAASTPLIVNTAINRVPGENAYTMTVDYDITLVRLGTTISDPTGNGLVLEMQVPNVNEISQGNNTGIGDGLISGTLRIGNPTCNIDAAATLSAIPLTSVSVSALNQAAGAPLPAAAAVTINATCDNPALGGAGSYHFTFADGHFFNRASVPQLTNTQIVNIGSAPGVALMLAQDGDLNKVVKYCDDRTDKTCWLTPTAKSVTQYSVTVRPYYVKIGTVSGGDVNASVNFAIMYD